MKKILMTLAIALGFAAIANADFISGTSFERYLSGGEKSALLNTSKDDLQGDTASFWEEGPTDSFVTNDTSIATEYTGDRPAVQSGESTQNNYLVVDATTTLNRLVNTDQTPTNIVDGLYFDSLVKFTVADAPDLTPETGDKLVVWMQAVGEEEAAQTNLVVTAGYLSAGNASSAKSYVVTTDAPILPDTWHRLTIKAIADIGNSANIPGFVVFIDGKPVTNTEAKGATGSVMDSLNATASVWAGKNALFPSLVVTGASAQSVTSVGFKGSGAVDDLVFTTTAPTFAADGTYFTLTWTPAAYASLKVDGVDVDDIAKGAQNFAFEGTKAFTVAYTLNSGWSTKDPEFSGTWTSGDNTYLFTATAACSATLNAAQALYQVGTDVFGTFEEALAAVKDAGSTGTIKLLGNIVLPYDGEEKLGTAVIDDGNVTIDLNGKKIKGSSLEGYATIHVGGGSVTIIDSVGGGIVEGPTLVEGELTWLGSAVTAGDGSTLLTAGQYDGIVEVGDGQLAITGGSYQGEDGEFYLIDYIDPDNYSATYASGYWTVAPGVTPVTYAVTWDESMPNVGVYATVDDDPIESGNKFEAGTEVVFVVTPDKGYTYVGVEIGTDWKLEEDDTITATFTVGTAALQVAIPAPEAIAPTEFTDLDLEECHCHR